MPVKKIQTFKNFSGGLNTKKSRSNLSDGEFSELLNWYLLEGRMRIRPGVVHWPIHSAVPALLDNTMGLLALTDSTGTWDLISLGSSTLVNVTFNGTSVNLTDEMSLAFASNSDDVWRAVQYKNYGYAVRPDLDYIIRFDDASYWKNGIAAPTTNAVIADGGVGSGEAGTFYGVYTFVDADGIESGVSPVSAAVTVAASRFFAWSSVDVSTNPRVTARKLYRTLPNQTGEYFYVATIADNTTTTANEAILTTNMGDLAPVSNAVPPTVDYVDIETAFERLWATDGSYVYASSAEDPDNFPAENIFAFSPDDGQPIKALKRLGSRLMVVKATSVWALGQSLGQFEFLPTVVDEKNGTISTKSVAVGDGYLFWFSGSAVFMSDGRSPGVDISSNKITFPAFNSATHPYASGITYNKYGWYMLQLSDKMYVYDYRRRYWTTFQYLNLAGAAAHLKYLAEAVDANGETHIYAGLYGGSGSAGSWISDLTPSGHPTGAGDLLGETMSGAFSISTNRIGAECRFRGIDFGAPGAMHTISRVFLLTNSPDAGAYSDANTQLLSEISIGDEQNSASTGGIQARLDVDIVDGFTMAWKNIPMPRGQKSSSSDLYIYRNSRAELIIEGVQIHGELYNWRNPPAAS